MVIAMRPSKGTRGVDGKLLSRLEWPYHLATDITPSFLQCAIINNKYYATEMGNFNLTNDTMSVESIKRHYIIVSA